jgi:hypothetical protein
MLGGTCTSSALPWLIARTRASARWHFKLHSLHTRTGVVYLGTASRAATVTGRASHSKRGRGRRSQVQSLQNTRPQCRQWCRRTSHPKSRLRKDIGCRRRRCTWYAPAVHALALAAVVDPGGTLTSVGVRCGGEGEVRGEGEMQLAAAHAPRATARAPRRTCCHRSGWRRTLPARATVALANKLRF